MATIQLKAALAVAANTASGINASGSTPITYSDTVWDDMQFPASPGQRGTRTKPDFDDTNIGCLMPQNDETEYISVSEQFSHKRKSATNISPHIHFIQTSASVPVFKMDYRWYDMGDAVPGSWTTIETDGTAALSYTSGSIINITPFSDIVGSDITGVSAWFEAKIYRKTGDGVSGDVLLKSFDIHYEIDGPGSASEYTK